MVPGPGAAHGASWCSSRDPQNHDSYEPLHSALHVFFLHWLSKWIVAYESSALTFTPVAYDHH